MKRVSLVGVVGVLSYLVLVPASGSMAATAAVHAANPVLYHATTRGHVTRLGLSTRGMLHLPAVKTRLGVKGGAGRVITFHSPGGPFPANKSSRGQATKIGAQASVPASTISGSTGASVVHKFNGVSNLDSDNLNGFPVTPPDQGLCVGRIGRHSPELVWEAVNLAARVTNRRGTPLGPDISLATLFNDPNAEGDPRCLYDSKTHTFFFTEIGFPPGGPAPDLNNTTVDVTVLNAHGVAFYQFDTSLGGPTQGDCFGDQPKTGFNNNALVVSTDEYCGPLENNYEGAIVLAISKPQLVALSSTINFAQFGPVSLGGIPVTGLDPAIGTGTGTDYLVNSFPFDASGFNNSVSNSLGLWALEDTNSITTGHGAPELAGRLIRSQTYAFPMPAASTGDGSSNAGIFSEAFLNPDDSRLSAPVEVTHSDGHVQLWTALDSGVAIHGDPAARDGAAWFRIDANRRKVVNQGFVAVKGAYLLYPAILAPQSGPPAMVFTVTSTSINPSAAFTTLGSKRVKIVAKGTGPHLSFSDGAPFFTPRWGDYSFAALDGNGQGIWLATEYIPPLSFQDPADNWGTSVFEVSK